MACYLTANHVLLENSALTVCCYITDAFTQYDFSFWLSFWRMWLWGVLSWPFAKRSLRLIYTIRFVLYYCHLGVCDQLCTRVQKTFFNIHHRIINKIVSRSNHYTRQNDNHIRQVVSCWWAWVDHVHREMQRLPGINVRPISGDNSAPHRWRQCPCLSAFTVNSCIPNNRKCSFEISWESISVCLSAFWFYK